MPNSRHTNFPVCFTFLFGLLDTGQVESRAAVRLFSRYPFRDVFLGFSLQVITQLVGPIPGPPAPGETMTAAAGET